MAGMGPRRRIALYALLVALTALAAGWAATRHICLSHDSMVYALVGDEVAAGRGLRQPVLRLDQTPDADGTAPHTVQPPLLPLLVAGLGGVTPQRVWPVRLINMAALVVSALSCFYITRRLAMDATALAAGLGAAVCFPLLGVSRFLWSEPPFVACMLGTIALLAASRSGSGGAMRKVFAAGVLAAGAFATRFAGVALLPLFVWEVAVAWRRRAAWPALGRLVVGLAVPLVVVTLIWQRNVELSGSIRGDWPARFQRSLPAAVGGLGRLMSADFSGVAPGLQAALIAAVLAAPLAVFARRLLGRAELRRELIDGGLDLVVLGGLLYAGVIVWSLSRFQPGLEPRFAVPLAPLMVIVVAVVLDRGWRAMAERVGPGPAAAGAAVSLALMLCYLGLISVVLLRLPDPEPHRAAESATLAWLVRHAPPGSRVVTNEPAQTAFHRGFVGIGLPHRREDPRSPLPDDMAERLERRMVELGARYLVLYAPQTGLNERHFGPFVAALSRRQPVSEGLTPIYDGPDGVIYALPPPVVPGPPREPAGPPATAPDASGR